MALQVKKCHFHLKEKQNTVCVAYSYFLMYAVKVCLPLYHIIIHSLHASLPLRASLRTIKREVTAVSGLFQNPSKETAPTPLVTHAHTLTPNRPGVEQTTMTQLSPLGVTVAFLFLHNYQMRKCEKCEPAATPRIPLV